MARNKRGHEMATGLTTRKQVNEAKEKGTYAIEIAENIHESSSTPEDNASHKARKERKAQRALRRAKRARKSSVASSGTDTTKLYDVLALYHQLNYNAIQEALEKLKLKPQVIDNNRLWLIGLNKETYEKVRDALLKCHFETKQHKQYKVRVAGYKHKAIVNIEKSEKKPTNNKPNVAKKAKSNRKEANKAKAALHVGHKQARAAAGKLRSQRRKNANHKPATLDTSSASKKLQERIKKACKTIIQTEKNNATQAKSKANKGIPPHKHKPVQQKLKFAA